MDEAATSTSNLPLESTVHHIPTNFANIRLPNLNHLKPLTQNASILFAICSLMTREVAFVMLAMACKRKLLTCSNDKCVGHRRTVVISQVCRISIPLLGEVVALLTLISMVCGSSKHLIEKDSYF